jgi:hypothetical protein
VASCSEHDNEPSDFINGVEVYQNLSDCYLNKTDSVPWR